MDDTDQKATYEELTSIEREFDDIDTHIIAQQYILSKPVYEKRAALTSKIRHFWPLALEQAPLELDQHIQPSDSEVFAACLTGISLSRFEIPADASASAAALAPGSAVSAVFGNPRSVAFRFEFAPNEWFEDGVLEKKFWFRMTRGGTAGLVSEPVKIHWKAGRDLTDGLTDAAVFLAEAVEKAGDPALRFKMKEYRHLVKKMEEDAGGSQSFFTWFGYKGGWATAAEHEEEVKADREWRAARARGEPEVEEDPPERGEDPMDEGEAEVFPGGEELAIALAEDFIPGALKYFTMAQEDEALSDIDFEEMEDDGDDDEEDEGEDAKIDIRSLVRDSPKNGGPPAKKRRT